MAALCAAALVAAGCGTSDKGQIRDAVRAFALGALAGDAGKACPSISPAHRKRVRKIFSVPTCAAFVKALHDDEPAERRRAQRLAVDSISIRGDHATARVPFAANDVKTVRLVRAGGRWLYDGFAPKGVQRPRRPATCPAHRLRRPVHPPRRPAHRGMFDARRLLGMPVAAASRLADRFRCTIRVTEQDGYSPYDLTADLRLNRVDVVTESDVVVRVGIG